jgi:hypothetical protein
MPWTVLTDLELARRRARQSNDRLPGVCRTSIDSMLQQASAVLRRRDNGDLAAVAALITGRPHCVPCISLVTELDSRRVYAALERLKRDTNVELVRAACTRCRRLTTVHVIPTVNGR